MRGVGVAVVVVHLVLYSSLCEEGGAAGVVAVVQEVDRGAIGQEQLSHLENQIKDTLS